MVQFFRDVIRERYRQQGMNGIFLWWIKTLLDLIPTVIEQHRKGNFTMSKATLIQFAGIFLILGGILVGLVAFSQLQPDDHYTYYGIYQIFILFITPGYLLVALGCVAISLRYAQASGKWMGWSLLLSAAGAVTMVTGWLLATILNPSLWVLVTAGMSIHTIGLVLFGMMHLQNAILPVFRALPLMIAAGFIAQPIFSPLLGAQSLINLFSFLMILGMGLGWVAIGISIQRQAQTVPSIAH
jgi:hypothetical protein